MTDFGADRKPKTLWLGAAELVWYFATLFGAIFP